MVLPLQIQSRRKGRFKQKMTTVYREAGEYPQLTTAALEGQAQGCACFEEPMPALHSPPHLGCS